MPRKPATRDERVHKLVADAPLAENAARVVLSAIKEGNQDKLTEAAKFLEAFGCYARRTTL